MTIATKKSPKKCSKLSENMDVLELYSPLKVGKILATSTKKKVNAFDTFRPNTGECLNYNISETLMKLDVGPTKINIKDTKATYTPIPPDMLLPKPSKKKIGGFCHGGPPLEHYSGDLWRAKQDALQERYKRELRLFIIRRKKRDKIQGKGWHSAIQQLVGPEWYQELSPNQLRTVDQLRNCILLDFKDHTIIHTQHNIGSLGLVLRPNYRNVKLALSLCCKCPVEFLLILYQLINPNRTEYSLNDRLLLSAVVHLTMRQTLREMHIRIPSPPPPQKVKVKPPKREKPLKYKSPYLVPYTFERPPRKHSGVYKNMHVQYPESPYFDYREELYIDKQVTENIFEIDLETLEPEEVDIIEDMRNAQTVYNSFQKTATIILTRPGKMEALSEYTQNFDGLKKDSTAEVELIVLPPLPTLPPNSDDDDDDRECECGQITEDTDTCCEDYFLTPCAECQEECKCRQKSKLYTSKCKKCLAKERKKNLKRVIGGGKRTPSDNIIPIIEGTRLRKDECDCLQRYKERLTGVVAANKMRCEKIKFVLGGVVITKIGPVYNLSTAYIEKGINLPVADEKSNTAEDDCCKQKKESDPRPCTCGQCCIKEESSNKPTCFGNNTIENDCCNAQEKNDSKPCTCGQCNIEEESSNREVIPCYNCRCKQDPESSPHQCPCGDHQTQTQKPIKDKGCCENEFLEPCECEGICDCKEQSKLYTSPKCPRCLAKQKLKCVQRIIGGLKKRKSKYVPIIEGTRLLKECDCLQKYKEKLIGVAARNRIKCHRGKFVFGGVVLTRKGPVYILSTAFISKPPRKTKTNNQICCITEDKNEEEEDCICGECKQEDDMWDEEIIKYSACRCREELDKFLAEKCTCEDCVVDARRLNATHIIAGSKFTESGTIVNILEGIHEQRCDCLSQYLDKIKQLDDYRQRLEARYQLRSQNLKYSIGGVVCTANGPVYAISGVRPPVECDCARELRRKAEEELRLSRMAKMPPTGRNKYQIAGVMETPEGNVYIVSQALPIDDCDCVRLYKTFKEAHKSCLDSYEEYLAQIQEEIEGFEAEAAIAYNKVDGDGGLIPDGEEDLNFDFGFSINNNEVVNEVEQHQYTDLEEQEGTQTYESEQICECLKNSVSSTSGSSSTSSNGGFSKKFTSTCTCATLESDADDEEDTDDAPEDEIKQGRKTSEDKKVVVKDGKKRRKNFGKKRGAKGSKRGGKKIDKKDEKKAEIAQEYHSKRFYITTKIPCNTKQQTEIVKKILTSMAEDGFPLAKLPDSYKLPHFKLWMQLRCGKFWTQEERIYYENFSKMGYCHADHCYREPPSPKLDITKLEASLMTWRDAAYCRKIVSEKIGMFYRLARQETVITAREFFPLTFSYEFPTTAFRDCYFAYCPSKEEEVMVYRIIKPYDARVNLKKFPCYCNN